MQNILFHRPALPKQQGNAAFTALVFTLLLFISLAGCTPRTDHQPGADQLPSNGQSTVEYRAITLPNGLDVMLVRDPGADNSAAALSVGAGSLMDPPERSGMAHFLEHMLFLGTARYPLPDEYGRFMTSNAGSSNAYTADDHTNYFFEIDSVALDEALDRFSQFFIAPLFNQELAEREMNAVDSEHAKNRENDYWRIQQAQRTLYNPRHPINRFSTGNLETLKGVGRGELLAFYRENYSSNLMKLSVVSNHDLDALEYMVRDRFSRIPNNKLAPRRFPSNYLDRKKALRVLNVEPVKDMRRLTLHFPMPSVAEHSDSKPLRLIGFVLGHEGRGSVLSLLKKHDLATALSAGMSENTADYAGFEINVELTARGLENWQEALRIILSAIQGLKTTGIPRYIYEENRIMAELEYRFQSHLDSSTRARMLSMFMQRIPMDKLPQRAFLYELFDQELTRRLINNLSVDNMLVTLAAQGLPTNQVEPHYGVRWSMDNITGPVYQKLAELEAHPEWNLPDPNRFLPESLGLHEAEGALKVSGLSLIHLSQDGVPTAIVEALQPLKNRVYSSPGALYTDLGTVLKEGERDRWFSLILKDSLPLPRKALDNKLARLWHVPDWRFRQPKASLSLRFYTEGAYSSPRRVMLDRLYAASLMESLNEYSYPIREAGLSFAVSPDTSGMLISVEGFSDKLFDLLGFLTERLNSIELDEKHFLSIKDSMIRGFQNHALSDPTNQSWYFADLLLESPNFTREALLEALQTLDLPAVRAHAARMWDRVYVEGVAAGNVTLEKTRRAVGEMLQHLNARALPESQKRRPSVRALPASADLVFTHRLPVSNSLGQVYFEVGETDPTLRGALLIIGRKLGESFYHELRTRQQLGYLVWAGMGQREKTLSLLMLIQSEQYSADSLLQRMNAFTRAFADEFKSMAGTEFESYRRAVIQAKLERPKNLSEAASRIFWVAFKHDEAWDYIYRDIEAVEKLDRKYVEEVLDRFLTGEDRRRLALRLIGREHEAGAPAGRPVDVPPETHPAGLKKAS
ncbi:MAG: insulinase family protein [Deltaproteobacteria bacterium]|nr:insulinase family protein [Deltaproteobacteria bacterium]